MNPTEIKQVLIKLGARPNKNLGQHFLIDAAALQTIVDTAAIKAGDRVLEVGPGLGVLTKALMERGAEVIAIEQDRKMIDWLSASVSVAAQFIAPVKVPTGVMNHAATMNGLSVIHGDAATLHWHDLVGDRPWKFISNLPYSITSLALRKALWCPKPPTIVVVLVQREVAERAIAKHGKTSLLSLMVALASSSSRIIKRVPPGAFYPPPKVESAILEIIPMDLKEREQRWGIDPEKIMALAKKGFAHPRKFLFSNLGISSDLPLIRASAVSSLDLSSGRRSAETGIEGVSGIHPKARAEDLSPDQWAQLTKFCAVDR